MPNIPGSDQKPRELVQPTFAGEAANIRKAHRLLLEAQALLQNESGSYPPEFSGELCDACDALDGAIAQAIRTARPVLRRLDAERPQ